MHHKSNHSDKTLIVNPKPYQCDTCHVGFLQQRSLKYHLKLYLNCGGSTNKSAINSITKYSSVPYTKIEAKKIRTNGIIRKTDPVKKANGIPRVASSTVFICKSCYEHFSAKKVLNRHLKYCKFHNP